MRGSRYRREQLSSRTCGWSSSYVPFLPRLTRVPARRAIAFETHGVHDPQEFVPERFMGPEPALDPANWAFGFARRYVSCTTSAINTLIDHLVWLSAQALPRQTPG